MAEYAQSSTVHMQAVEGRHMPATACVTAQAEVNESMRAILVSWLIEVHLRFNLRPETLFITVNLIDRYCEVRAVPRKEYQLLGVTAMMVACKYEEINLPDIKEFISMTDDTYSKPQMLAYEEKLLRALNFDLTFPSTRWFLDRYSALMEATRTTHALACYLAELCLVEVHMNKWSPSLIACACLFSSSKIQKLPVRWADSMEGLTRHSEREVRTCAREICQILDKVSARAVYKPILTKYTNARFLRVAKIPILRKQEDQKKIREREKLRSPRANLVVQKKRDSCRNKLSSALHSRNAAPRF